LSFSQLWWGRHEAGIYLEGEYDVLESLGSTMVSMWCLDLTPVVALIEKKALAQFRENKDSMKVLDE
jgi:hypothetical protein